MKKIFKWTALVLGGLFILVLLILVYLNHQADNRIATKFTVEPQLFAIPTDSVSLQKGAHWVSTLCTYCHGENLSGKLYSESPGFGKFYSSNITRGKGGVGGFYTDKDWIRAIRHGIAPDGRGLVTMPSSDFNHLSASDIGAIIAYLKTIPAVDHEVPRSELQFMGKSLLALGALNGIISAEVIDHSLPPPPSASRDITVQFGAYLVNAIGCRTCHGPELKGMQPPMPGAPFAPALTPGGNLDNWSPEKFSKAMRTGITPEGKKLNAQFMPVAILGKLTDDELRATFLYLRSLPGTKED